MDLDIFLGLIFLLLWLLCEAVCIWFIMRDQKQKNQPGPDAPLIVYGSKVGIGGSRRKNSQNSPNFYS